MDINNTNTRSVKTFATVLSLSVASLFSAGVAYSATQNEIQLLAVDVEGADDNLFGASYVRYLNAVDDSSGAYLINPYLQRVSSLSGGYYSVDDNNIFTLGSTFYLDKHWMVALEGAHVKSDDRYSESDGTLINATVGFNLSPQWQVGAGVVYSHESYDFNDGTTRISESDNDTDLLAFMRYTTVNKLGSGWDFLAQYTSNDADDLQASARYFFSPALSVAGALTYVDAPDGFDNSTTAGIEVDYWFNEQFSVKASYETDIDGDTNADVAMLNATYRF